MRYPSRLISLGSMLAALTSAAPDIRAQERGDKSVHPGAEGYARFMEAQSECVARI